MSEKLKSTHVQKAHLAFTREELATLLEALDRPTQVTWEDITPRVALRVRLAFARDSLPPTGGVR